MTARGKVEPTAGCAHVVGPPGSMIADVPSAKGLAGQSLEGTMIFEVPPQWKVVPQAVLREAARREIVIRDSNGRIYHAD